MYHAKKDVKWIKKSDVHDGSTKKKTISVIVDKLHHKEFISITVSLQKQITSCVNDGYYGFRKLLSLSHSLSTTAFGAGIVIAFGVGIGVLTIPNDCLGTQKCATFCFQQTI